MTQSVAPYKRSVGLGLSNVKNKIRFEKWLAVLIAVSPLLTYYDFPFTSISLSSIMLFVISLLSAIYAQHRAKKNNTTDRVYIFLAFYNLIYSIIIIILRIGTADKIYVHFFLLLSLGQIIYISRISNSKSFYSSFSKVYLGICFFISIVSVTEEVIYIATGSLFPVKLPFLPLNDAYIKWEHRFGFNGRGDFMGFSPFFSEPAHLAQYFLPAFIILLHRAGSLKKMGGSVIVFLAMCSAIVISTSSFGIAATAIVTVVYSLISKSKVAKLLRKIIIIAFLAIIVVVIVDPDGLLGYEFRALLEGFSQGNDKTTYRLFRGFVYFSQFPAFAKLFGIGYGNFSFFITKYDLKYEFEITNSSIVTEYLNGISQALVYNGIIGLFLLVLFFWFLFRKGNAESKTLTIGLVLLMAVTATYLRGNSVFYIIIIYMLKQQRTPSKKMRA